jgi:anti-sigma regulatory factor (Ser/Thr protein kinase)
MDRLTTSPQAPSADERLAAPVLDGTDQTEHPFHHETLFYSGEPAFLDGTLPFIADALAAEEPVLVAVADDKIDALKRALGPEAPRVSFTDMRVLGHNPARIIPAWRQFLNDNASEDRSVRGIGEPAWAGRSAAELDECQRHELLLNLAFEQGPAWRLLCSYDLASLDEQVIEHARHSHPFIAADRNSRRNASYLQGDAAPGPFNGMLPAPPAGASVMAFSGEELGAVRQRLHEWASTFEPDDERTEHLVLAVTELASNSVRHGGGGGTLRMWREERALLVEVQDSGRIEEPLVGRLRPGPDQPTGRGLWLVNHLCDLVQIRSAPTGSVVRVHMYSH